MDNFDVKKIPFFSVCIPVYNAGKYLNECIDSVLCQTYNNYEIILVNDGSTDESGVICDEYTAKYDNITVFHKNNEGPLIARHDAVKLSKGLYLLFLDSDDLFIPNAFQMIKETVNKHDADMIFFDWQSFSEKGDGEIQTELFDNGVCFVDDTEVEFRKYFMSNAKLNSMCRKCIRRDLYNTDIDYSLYKGMVQGEDKLVSIHCVDCAQKIVYLKEALYKYRVNFTGTSHNITLKNYKDVQLLHHEVLKYIELWGLPLEVRNSRMRTQLECVCNCVLSLASRVKEGKSTKEDFVEAVNYIASDKDFLGAYEISGKQINLPKRILSKCVIKRRYRVIKCLSWLFQVKRQAFHSK